MHERGRKRQRVTYCPYNCINQIPFGLTLVLHSLRGHHSPWTLLKPDISLCFSERNKSFGQLFVFGVFMKKLKYLTETLFLYIYTCICKSQSDRNLSCALVFVPVFVFESGEAVNLDVVGSVYVNVDEPYCASRREAGLHQEQQRAPSPIATTTTTSTTNNNTKSSNNNNTRSNNEHQAQL